MSIAQKKIADYDKRIERANYLAAEYSFAAKPLKFYAQVTQFQKELFCTLVKEWGNGPARDDDFRAEPNFTVLLREYPRFLGIVEAHAPKPLAAAANDVSLEGSPAWMEL